MGYQQERLPVAVLVVSVAVIFETVDFISTLIVGFSQFISLQIFHAQLIEKFREAGTKGTVENRGFGLNPPVLLIKSTPRLTFHPN